METSGLAVSTVSRIAWLSKSYLNVYGNQEKTKSSKVRFKVSFSSPSTTNVLLAFLLCRLLKLRMKEKKYYNLAVMLTISNDHFTETL